MAKYKYIYIKEITNYDFYIEELQDLLATLREKCTSFFVHLDKSLRNMIDFDNDEIYLEDIFSEVINVNTENDVEKIEKELMWIIKKAFIKEGVKRVSKKMIYNLLMLWWDYNWMKLYDYNWRDDVRLSYVDNFYINNYDKYKYFEKKGIDIVSIINNLIDEIVVNYLKDFYSEARWYSQWDVSWIYIIYKEKKRKEKEVEKLLTDFEKLFKRLYTYQEFELFEIESKEKLNKCRLQEIIDKLMIWKEIKWIKVVKNEIIDEEEVFDYKDEEDVIIEYLY